MQTDPRLEPSTPLLRLQELKIAYGGIQAVKGIALELHAGETVCLIGANGAGKTTTLNAIAGVLPIAGGDIHYKGERINALPAHRRLRAGIALVPEGRGIFTRLTVEENLRMGAYTRKDAAAIEADLERVDTRLPRVKERLAQVAGTLSGGEQQMVAIARGLMGLPRLMMFDEPSLGLAPILVQEIFNVVKRIRDEGTTVLLVEQNVRQTLAIADRAYVLETGRVEMQGRGQDLLRDPHVEAAYLGL